MTDENWATILNYSRERYWENTLLLFDKAPTKYLEKMLAKAQQVLASRKESEKANEG